MTEWKKISSFDRSINRSNQSRLKDRWEDPGENGSFPTLRSKFCAFFSFIFSCRINKNQNNSLSDPSKQFILCYWWLIGTSVRCFESTGSFSCSTSASTNITAALSLIVTMQRVFHVALAALRVFSNPFSANTTRVSFVLCAIWRISPQTGEVKMCIRSVWNQQQDKLLLTLARVQCGYEKMYLLPCSV